MSEVNKLTGLVNKLTELAASQIKGSETLAAEKRAALLNAQRAEIAKINKTSVPTSVVDKEAN